MFFFTETATTWIYTYVHTLSLPDALPICLRSSGLAGDAHSPHLFSVRAERVEALSVFNRRKKERPFDTLRANGGAARKRLHPCRDDDRPGRTEEKRGNGFTLVEMMIDLSIFAAIPAMGRGLQIGKAHV